MVSQSNLGVLLIDMQESFLYGIPSLNYLIESQVRVLKKCAEYDVPVIALEFTGEGKTIDKLLVPFKKVPRKNIVKKNTLDGFCNKELAKQLQDWNIKHLFLMGVYGSGCVYQTALGAKEGGFKVFTAGDVIRNTKYIGEDSIPFAYNIIGKYFLKHQDFFSDLSI